MTEAKTKECKQDVFEELLAKYFENPHSYGELVKWRERYEKAERFEFGYHDVHDLYESPPEEPK